jgi:hypothetical protein
VLVLGQAGVLVELVLLVYCVLNIVTTPKEQVRNLPKPVWLVLVVLLPLVGGIAWLVAGRPKSGAGGPGGLPYKGNTGRGTQPGRTERARAQHPDDDEGFLRSLRERAEEQRRQGEEQRRAEERKRAEGGDPAP